MQSREKSESGTSVHPASRDRQPAFWVLLTFLAVVFTGCGITPMKSTDELFHPYGSAAIEPSKFQVCHGHGCRNRESVGLSGTEWQGIRDLFTPAPRNAPAERRRIARAIQAMEILTGAKTGIDADIGGTFPGTFRKGQMDCEDEAVNTGTFLLLMQNDGLFRFHRIYGIARRGMFPLQWPHMAVVIVENKTSALFIVDSWFFDQGMPVHVVPGKAWAAGWRPSAEGFRQFTRRNAGQ